MRLLNMKLFLPESLNLIKIKEIFCELLITVLNYKQEMAN